MLNKNVKLRCPRCEHDFEAEECVTTECPNCSVGFEWTESGFIDGYDVEYYWMPNWF